MIKLRLEKERASFSEVRNIPGLDSVQLDEDYGLICIDPAEDLYVVRTTPDSCDLGRLQDIPEVIQVYGDIRISEV